MSTLETTVSCQLGDFDVLVEYSYTPAQRGRYSGPPEDCYPDEPEEIEIEAITWIDGTPFPHELAELDREALLDEIREWEQVCKKQNDEDAAYAAYEARRELDDA